MIGICSTMMNFSLEVEMTAGKRQKKNAMQRKIKGMITREAVSRLEY